MARVITFSREFPGYHPKAGQPTNFIQKFWTSIKVPLPVSIDAEKLEGEVQKLMFQQWTPKHHTIRLGNRWKIGDKFSPRIWSGKPYQSKQLILSDDISIKYTCDIEICPYTISGNKKPAGVSAIIISGKLFYDWNILAFNDGLTQDDLCAWFKPGLPFKGQIICWDSNIKY